MAFDGVARLHVRRASEAEAHHDMPMDFADAALVCVAEGEGLTRILTFDRRLLN